MHLATTPNGKFKPCCLYSENIKNPEGLEYNTKDNTFGHAWNSKHMEDIRQTFLEGEFPSGCSQCKNEELANIESKRLIDNNKFKAFSHLITGNIVEHSPIYLDVKLGTLCNLKCRICSSAASSKWPDEEIFVFNDDFERVVKANENKAFETIDYPEFWANIEEWIPHIEYLDFTGGEPLLIKEHFKLLEYAIEHGYSKNIEIHYNTNGTVLIKDFAKDIWSKFKHINIMFSIDDLGERFEMQRYPAKWDKVEANIIKSTTYDFITTEVCCTVGVLNIHNMPNILDKFREWGVHYYINLLHGPDHYNVKTLPPNMKRELTERLGKLNDSQITPLLEYMNSEQMSCWDDFIRLTQRSDEFRGHKILDVLEEYSDMDKKMKVFCTAPWTHTYVSPQGERRLCCASREEATFQQQYLDVGEDETTDVFKPATLEEHWNNPHMKSVRKRILAGEEIDECQVCNETMLNLHTYRKYFTTTLFPNMYEEIISNTDEDGGTTLKPVSFDYRLSNQCNFKCRMCGEQLSSAWESEKKKHGIWDEVADKWMKPEYRIPIKEFQEFTLEAELQEAVDNGVVRELYWVGGEPLMWTKHWDIMQQLVDEDRAKDVVVRYNTNLSKIHQGPSDLYELLTHYKQVNVCASIDATGTIGEYIRTGLRWDSWIEDFKKGMFLLDQFGDDAMVFDVTLTTPGLFGMKEMFDLVTELDIKSYVKITFAFDPKVFMCPYVLPRHILDPILDDLIAYCEPKVTPKTQVYVDTFKEMKTRPTFEEQYPDYIDGFRIGKARVEKIEKIRNDTTVSFKRILREHCRPAYEWYMRGYDK